MDKTITTALLIIAGIVCIVFVFNSVYPMVNRSSQEMANEAQIVSDRMKSRIVIIDAANTLDLKTVYVWVKNVGSSIIQPTEKSDVFFGQEGSFNSIPYLNNAQGAYPSWSFELENDTEWQNGATLKITITYDKALDPGIYYIKIVIPNGVSDEYFFSM